MKQIILFLHLCILTNVLYSQDYDIIEDSLTAYIYDISTGNMNAVELAVIYYEEENTFYLYVNHPSGIIEITLNEIFRKVLLKNIGKYKEQYKQAISDEVEIEEPIGILPPTEVAFEKSIDSWCVFDSLIIETMFFSENIENHRFVLEAKYYIDCDDNSDPKELEFYFKYDDVMDLEKAIGNDITEYFKRKEELDKIVKDLKGPFKILLQETIMDSTKAH